MGSYEYLKNNNYGMGPGYQTTVANLGNELLADPSVSKYVKSKGYR